MTEPLTITGSVWKDGGASIMARVTGTDGANIVQADITSITCAVFDKTGASVSTPSVVVATSVFDTLQTDSRWTVDSTGYNFRFDAAASVMVTADERYRWEFLFTPASGEVFWVVAVINVQGVLTS